MSEAKHTAIAFAPASVGNVAVGFDLLGHALDGPCDRVTARRTERAAVSITRISGVASELPMQPDRNTAGVAVRALLDEAETGFGVELEIDKGIPLGSGLGGSAASAVAAVVAANALLEQALSREALYPFALAGEAVASGSAHGDNVGAQLLGGLVLAAAGRLVSIPVPSGLIAVVVHPDCVVETRHARNILDAPYTLSEFVDQSAKLALVLAGCFRNNISLIKAGLQDVLVEPRRKTLVPGFDRVRQAALDHGALGASLSGAGPSIFGWFEALAAAQEAGAAMAEAFAEAGLESRVILSPVDAPGARLETTKQ